MVLIFGRSSWIGLLLSLLIFPVGIFCAVNLGTKDIPSWLQNIAHPVVVGVIMIYGIITGTWAAEYGDIRRKEKLESRNEKEIQSWREWCENAFPENQKTVVEVVGHFVEYKDADRRNFLFFDWLRYRAMSYSENGTAKDKESRLACIHRIIWLAERTGHWRLIADEAVWALVSPVLKGELRRLNKTCASDQDYMRLMEWFAHNGPPPQKQSAAV